MNTVHIELHIFHLYIPGSWYITWYITVEMESLSSFHHPVLPQPRASLPAAAVVGIVQEMTLPCINQIQNRHKSFWLTC